MRQMKLNDLNLCNLYSSPLNLWEQNIKFARNLISKCTINLQEIVNLKQETIFNTIFLNYYENQANFLQTVPIAIRDAFDVNKVSSRCFWVISFLDQTNLFNTVGWHREVAVGETFLLGWHSFRSTILDKWKNQRWRRRFSNEISREIQSDQIRSVSWTPVLLWRRWIARRQQDQYSSADFGLWSLESHKHHISWKWSVQHWL